MAIDVTVMDIDDDQIDTLFGGVASDKTFKAEDLTPAQKKEDEPSKDKSTKAEKQPSNSEKQEETPEVTEINEEDENDLFSTDAEEDEVKQSKKTSKEERSKDVKSTNFKNLVDHFIDSGKWVDFEGREDIEEVSEEDFLKI